MKKRHRLEACATSTTICRRFLVAHDFDAFEFVLVDAFLVLGFEVFELDAAFPVVIGAEPIIERKDVGTAVAPRVEHPGAAWFALIEQDSTGGGTEGIALG